MKKTAIIILLLLSAIGNAAIIGNLDGDCKVAFLDFAIFAEHWKHAESGGVGDFDNSGTVDFKDLAIFAGNWLEEEEIVADPPAKASSPTPADTATDIPLTQALSWTMTGCLTSADVWFSESGSMTKVVSNTMTTTYTPTLEKYHSYQWRIDTLNTAGTTTGDVWSFSTVLNVAPAAVDSNQTAYAFITKSITLTATDDNYPSALNYYIVTVPNDVNVYLQDPASGCGKITAALCPYRLRNGGNIVWLAADNAETFAFTWKANDGALDSNTATTTTVVSANPHDCLTFDGGYVSVPDNANIEFADGRMVSFFIKTRTPTCPIMKKRGTAQGWEVSLESGRPKFEVFDSSGTKILSGRSNWRIDNGQWWFVNIKSPDDINETYIRTDTSSYGYDYIINIGNWPNVDITNSEPLIIGQGFKGELDNIRFYLDYSYSDALLDYYDTDIRNTAGDAGFLMREANVRWKMTEGTGSTITDDKLGLVGTISGNVYWTPKNWYWSDINVLRWLWF